MQLSTLPPPIDRPIMEDSQSDSNKVCTYYQRTGCCSFGNDCKYKHDPNSILPLAGYTENGYPKRPGCESCTFYVATGWCNHWFSCSKDHDGNRLTGECKESLPPPTIMEQFHRFKYHSFTKEYKPLSTNHLPPAIRDKRWIVGNEYGQSAIPRSAQNRILQSFKNGIPEDVKDRLYRFLPQDATARNMQLIRTNTGGYMTSMVPNCSGMLSRALSAPHQQYIPAGGITSKVMTPHPLSPTTTTIHPQRVATPSQPATQYAAAAAAAGYHMPRLNSAAYQMDSLKSPFIPAAQQQQRYYTMMQPSSGLSTYSPVYPTAYTVDAAAAAAVSTSTSTSPSDQQPQSVGCGTMASPQQSCPPTTCAPMNGGYYYTTSPQAAAALSSPQQQPPTPVCSGMLQTGQYSMYQQGGASQYQQYMQYGAQAMTTAYSMPLHMTYPTHGWSYANESSGDSSAQTGQILEDQDVVESAFKGYKVSEDRSNLMDEDDGLFYDH